MSFTGRQPRLADSAVGAALNGAINGAIAWHGFRGSASIPLSVDRIGAPGVTALGNAATLAFSLVLIVTCITFFVFRRGARKSPEAPATLRDIPFLWVGFRMAIANTVLAFGAFVTMAVLWQRLFGTVETTPLGATAVIALVSAVATVFAEWRTKAEMLALADRPRER